jgi:hypothetical protein
MGGSGARNCIPGTVLMQCLLLAVDLSFEWMMLVNAVLDYFACWLPHANNYILRDELLRGCARRVTLTRFDFSSW